MKEFIVRYQESGRWDEHRIDGDTDEEREFRAWHRAEAYSGPNYPRMGKVELLDARTRKVLKRYPAKPLCWECYESLPAYGRCHDRAACLKRMIERVRVQYGIVIPYP